VVAIALSSATCQSKVPVALPAVAAVLQPRQPVLVPQHFALVLLVISAMHTTASAVHILHCGTLVHILCQIVISINLLCLAAVTESLSGVLRFGRLLFIIRNIPALTGRAVSMSKRVACQTGNVVSSIHVCVLQPFCSALKQT
jgi:hypothetical protein